MAKLVLSRDGSIVQQRFIDRGQVSVGRESHNDIVIDDPMVSREHATIVPIGNDHILEDLASANGTIVNGVRVPRRILQHGDVIELGAFNLRYLNPRSASEIDLERTMLIPALPGTRGAANDGAGPAPAEPRVPTTHAARIRFPRARVRMLAGPRAGGTIELDRVVATFGKPGKQLAVITRRPYGYFVTHVEGRRTARVNGRPLGRATRPLERGDVLDVGGERLEFQPD